MLNNKRTNPPAVLKFIYLSFLILITACGDDSQKETNTTETKLENAQEEKKDHNNVILCFGNSLTEGLGLNPDEAYPALLQNKIDSLQLDYQVINAGISGETTSGGKNRLSWVLKSNIKIFILELGANDGLRGIPLTETEQNLQSIIDTVKSTIPNATIVLAGMQIPPNLGIEYTNNFMEIFPRLATKNNITLIPFLLEGVAGIPELNQKDGSHPTAEGTKRVAENVWKIIQKLVQ